MTEPAQRADPFAVDTEPDIASFKPKQKTQNPAAARETIRQVSEQNNFPSREAGTKQAPAPMPRQQRRRRTGRSVQINIKATQETVDLLISIADRRGWVFGEVLEHALKGLAVTDDDLLSTQTAD